jgi:hypothetical protein
MDKSADYILLPEMMKPIHFPFAIFHLTFVIDRAFYKSMTEGK